MSEMNKEKKFKSIKKHMQGKQKVKIIFFSIIIILFIFIGIKMHLLDNRVERNQYFVDYGKGTSTIYCFDVDKYELKELWDVDGKLCRGVINEERTQLIGLVENRGIIVFDLCNGSILNEIIFSELEDRQKIEMDVFYLTPQFDFTDDGMGVYFTMCMDQNYQIYLYNFETDELKLINEGMYFSHSEFVGDYIYYIDYEDNSIKRYYVDTCETETMVSFSVAIDAFSVSPDGEKILIDVRAPRPTDELYIYNIAEDKLRVAERGYYFSDIAWNGDSYVYIEEHWGILSDINPSIKVDNGRGIMDKEIYRIKGFFQGGTLWLIENPSNTSGEEN